MIHPNFKFLRSVGIMIGGIVGAGVFGLPYAISKSGAAIGLFELLVIGGFLLILQLMFAEVVLQTQGNHRLAGYVEHYLGEKWKWVTVVALSFGIWGAMLAYMIIGGDFLSNLFSPGAAQNHVGYSFAIALITSIMIYGGLKTASKVESAVVAALLFLFVFVIFACVPHLKLENFLYVDHSQIFIPYGVVLFALTGLGIVPEMKDVLGMRGKRLLAPTIFAATSLIIILYFLFSASVVGVTGTQTAQTVFDALVPHIGSAFGAVTSLLGALTIISIYSVLGIELMNTFQFDFKIPHPIAWVLVVCVPVSLFALGVREFIGIIGFVGAVFNGMLGIMVVLIYFKMRRRNGRALAHCINFPSPLVWLLVAIFGIGIVVEVASILF